MSTFFHREMQRPAETHFTISSAPLPSFATIVSDMSTSDLTNCREVLRLEQHPGGKLFESSELGHC